MNLDHLNSIFANYIRKFEHINSPDCNENYKWEIAKRFHDLIDPDNPDFAHSINEAWKLSDNLIDSSNRYCFSALVTCAQKDEEAVRELFRNLFEDDGGDLAVRQQKILEFIEQANALTEKYHSSNGMFMNDQRSAMAYLFLNDPDNHYLYKASEANSFASCIEYYEDWGSGANFKLDAYYRMCDLLVEAIRKNEALRKTHESRFFDKDGQPLSNMHPDENYHILAFDIIYGAPEFRYNFYEGIPFTSITASARKLHQERTEKAAVLYQALVKAQEDAKLLAEANDYYLSLVPVGASVMHKMFKEGTVTAINGSTVSIEFPTRGETKSFTVLSAFAGGFLTVDTPDFAERKLKYQPVAMRSNYIESALKSAQTNFEPYRDYLE